VVPACRSLDAVSIFALTAADAAAVFGVARGFDPDDAYSREAQPHGRRFNAGQPSASASPRHPARLLRRHPQPRPLRGRHRPPGGLGGTCVELDFSPFLETASLLYGGPWVAERYHAIRDFIEQKPGSVFPVTREITLGGGKASAVEAFDAFYRLKAYKRRCDAAWNEDLILTPTAGRHPTIAAMQADPIRLNTELGYYTNFMNLLDYAAVAVPAAFRPDGLPFGVTLRPRPPGRPPAGAGRPLAAQHRPAPGRHRSAPAGGRRPASGVPDGMLRVAVCGAHLSGLPSTGSSPSARPA
jgi:allophanate hydrolase